MRFHAVVAAGRRHLAGGGLATRLPHANKIWMLAGFALFERLKDVAECLETYPQAIIRTMGGGAVHKSHDAGVVAQLELIRQHTGWPLDAAAGLEALRCIGSGSSHDKLDAYMCAWIASLNDQQRVALGAPPDDAIWVPKDAQPTKDDSFTPAHLGENASRPRANGSSLSARRRACPACLTTIFRRWPWGWDAHAAHRCSGLEGTDPEERKAEFRRRFLSDDVPAPG
jgi:hypothetical protein